MKKLKVGQIGCGAFAECQDFPNFAKNEHTEVTWCCDISLTRAQEMAAKFNVANVTTDYMDVINDPEVDLIKICTSHEVHLPIIEAAAAQGKHIFSEKPLALDEQEIYRIIRVVRKSGVKLCVDFNRRLAPSLIALREKYLEHKNNPVHQPWRYIESDRKTLAEELETQFTIRIQDESASYRMVHLDPLHGGGTIIGESVHWLDLICWFFAPQIPIEIQGWGSTRMSHGIHVKMSGGDNATIIFNCGGTFDYPKELFEVTHNGALFRNLCFTENQYFGIPGLDTEKFPMQHDSVPHIGTEGGFAGYMKKYQARVSGLENAKNGWEQFAVDKGHENMLNTFVDAVINDKESPCDELAGLQATYLANLAIKSIRERSVLPVCVDALQPVTI